MRITEVMNREESKLYCIGLLNSFITEELNGDINQICMFDLTKLDENGKFGKPEDYPNDWKMDPDDCLITRAVLYLLFHEEIEELTIDDIGFSKNYRGDTLFTSGNLLGKPLDVINRNGNTFWKQIKNLDENVKEELQDIVVKFLCDYHTFSNMTLFPNKRIMIARESNGKITDKLESINNYRGMNQPGFSDYVDIFLNELEKCIVQKGDDRYLKELFEKNAFYFCRYVNDFQKLCNSHFFQVFYSDEDVTKGLRQEYMYQHYVRWMKLNNPQTSYSDEIQKYISGFNNMRKFRNGKIIERLKKII